MTLVIVSAQYLSTLTHISGGILSAADSDMMGVIIVVVKTLLIQSQQGVNIEIKYCHTLSFRHSNVSLHI